MKTFKGYLKEEVAWQQSTSKMIFDFGDKYGIKIPLSSAIIDKVFPEKIQTVVFHVTDIKGGENLIKLQNKKKSVSAFFFMDTSYLMQGIKSNNGGTIAELDGNVIVSAESDIMSMPDKTGRRWIELHDLDKKETMHAELEKMLVDLAVKHDPRNKAFLTISPEIGMGVWWKLQTDLLTKFDPSKAGKKMSLIIADYIDGVATILKKHKNDIQGAVHGYIVRRGTVAVKHASGRMVGGDSELSEWNAWDEQVVNEIKIEKVHTFNTATRPAEWVKDSVIPRLGKIPHKHWKSATELSTYISQVADAEVRTLRRSKG